MNNYVQYPLSICHSEMHVEESEHTIP